MADEVRVSVIHPNGAQKFNIEAPANVPMNRLVPALATQLGLPNVDNRGQPIAYRLATVREGQEQALNEDQTFASAGVQNDDALRLYSDLRAGASTTVRLCCRASVPTFHGGARA
jgi:hypothetical protein